MRLFLMIALATCGAARAIVLLQNPTCGGLVVGRHAILTLKECITSNSELIAPIKLQPTHFVMHKDERVGILFFAEQIPYEPINFGGSKNNPLGQHLGQKVNIGNSIQSTDSSIIQISETHLWTAGGVLPALPGSPMWAVTSPSRSYKAIGLMTAQKQALRLDPYTEFITSYAYSLSDATQKIISLPAVPVSIKKPIISLGAHISSGDPNDSGPAPIPEPHKQIIEEPNSMSPPQSLGCACSQTGTGLTRHGFMRRLLKF